MEWVWRKIDVLVAAVFVAAGAIGASQGHAFMIQYEEHLGRDLEQARGRLAEVKTGLRYKLMSEVVRAELEATAQTRFDQLNIAHTSIAGASIIKPYALARHEEPALLAETERNFVPRLPNTPGGIFSAILGAVIAFAIYEILKLPLSLLAQPRQRKFRRRP